MSDETPTQDLSDKSPINVKKRVINLHRSPKGVKQLKKPVVEKFKKRTIKMTDRMYARCVDRAEELGISFSELGRQCMSNGVVVAAGLMEQLAASYLELHRQGTNLNQCTHELNSEKFSAFSGHERMVLVNLLEAIVRVEESRQELLGNLSAIEKHHAEIRKHGVKLILRVEVPVADTIVSEAGTKDSVPTPEVGGGI